MKSDASFSDLNSEQNFYAAFHQISRTHTIEEIWNELEPLSNIKAPEVLLACADVAMCADKKEAALTRYTEWLDMDHADTSFLPFARLRIAASDLIEPILPKFFALALEDDFLSKLVGVGALFSTSKWADLDKLCGNRSDFLKIEWQISAAVAFAKAANFDYLNASAFFVPSLLQGHGLSKPHNGCHDSISHAAEECAALAREYTYIMRAAEKSLIAAKYEKKHTAESVDHTKIDMFIKTCAKDEQFLIYCLRSIDKFVHGFRRVVIVTDDDHDFKCSLAYDHVIHRVSVPSAPPTFGMISGGYRMQMVVKLCWTDFSDADAVVITDSDTIFTRLFSPEQMFFDGHPIWYYGDWSYGISWRAGSELVVGENMPNCCMREHPFIFTRDATLGFQDYINRRFDCSIFDLFFTEKIVGKFCEFEILGGYLSHVSSHGYAVKEHQYMGIVRQYWSWGGVTDDVKANVEEHLGAEARS